MYKHSPDGAAYIYRYHNPTIGEFHELHVTKSKTKNSQTEIPKQAF